MSTTNTQKQAAKQFVKEWAGKGYEKGETQRFWIDLLHTVFGIDNPTKMMEFELPVKTITKEKGSDFIDGYITATKVLIEQKGSHIDLSAKYRHSSLADLYDETVMPVELRRAHRANDPQSSKPTASRKTPPNPTSLPVSSKCTRTLHNSDFLLSMLRPTFLM